ncbi:hypothetical protein W59_08289 [Rhodococcus opacus RKJ300 = JCM 13270]|uniref:Uncharacterized protein n=1 Tax=Rhodococcus opacus RKJ300 = JCM 13270 TaxID=1165867 RepID=I0WUY2_RHOOP|nr:hypothetical protein W59_08289 [Rhodococcus opacus RKJ300 = JCM 13270]
MPTDCLESRRNQAAEATGTSITPLRPVQLDKHGIDLATTNGQAIPLADWHQSNHAEALSVGLWRYVDVDPDGTDRYITVESLDRDSNPNGDAYMLTAAGALQLATDLTTAAMLLLADADGPDHARHVVCAEERADRGRVVATPRVQRCGIAR